MRRMVFVLMLFTPLTFAFDVTNVRFSNIREGSSPDRVTVDVAFEVNYRGFTDNTYESKRLRANCAPSSWVSAYLTAPYFNKEIHYYPSVPVSTSGYFVVSINDVAPLVLPEREEVTVTLVDVPAGASWEYVVQGGNDKSTDDPDVCTFYDFKHLGAPSEVIPPVRPQCDIFLMTNPNHGAVTLSAVGDAHTANGSVQVSCDSTASVTVSTGHTGAVKINDTLSTEISIDGELNRATRTINGAQLLPVTSRLYRTSAGSWGGDFSKPVILTITWP